MSEIVRTFSGFEQETGLARSVYDADGRYLSQYQPDMISDDPHAGDLWLPTYPGDRCYHELTAEQMASAFDPGSMYEPVRDQPTL